MEHLVKEFYQSEFEQKIDEIIDQLTDKDCQRVEFLRGMMSAYKQLIEERKGWDLKKQDDYFK